MKKGFTLVELLGVIVILAIIALLTFPAIEKVIKKSSDTVYDAQINTILTAAYDFSLKNISFLPNNNEIKYITLGELKLDGLVDFDIKDPRTKEKFPDNLVISIRNVGNSYKNNSDLSRKTGNYLYTIELSNLDNKSLEPIINLTGLTKNSNGDYILIKSLNESLSDISYTAQSISGVNLTDKVRYYIESNDSVVDSINTSNPGIYKIHYFVIDDNWYAKTLILNVIISDTTPPTITIPSNNTINKNISNFNLMEGVECSDNSGFCDVTYSGEINFGVVGKYIIEYTAKDPSGNTGTSKRVITVK